MSTQGFARLRCAVFLAGSLLCGCAGVPPAPDDAPVYPPVIAPKPPEKPGLWDSLTGKTDSPPSGNVSKVVPASATETIAGAPAANGEEKRGFEMSDLAPGNLWKNVKKATGYGPDEKLAGTSLQEGKTLFSQKKYTEAIDKFKTAVSRWPDSTLEEDAQFLLAECYYFSDQYPKAHDSYGELLKKHDNTRYLDTVVVREFELGRYWEQKYFKDPHWLITPNLTDKERPLFDTFGNALDAYQRVRTYDPTGPLADDAVMATANAHFVRGQFETAAYNYDLLRKEYPTSKFQPQAHVLGLQAKLRVYQGKDYDGVPLADAEEIARQALTQFGSQLGPERERIAQTSKEIVEMKADRDWALGQYYEKKKCFGAARYYYQNLIQVYPLTQRAQSARERIEQIRDKPDVPPNYLKGLTDLFPPDTL